MTAPEYSPAPWAYEYSPCQGRNGEIPAFEIFDADCNKVFDTNEDTDAELQESNARLWVNCTEVAGRTHRVCQSAR